MSRGLAFGDLAALRHGVGVRAERECFDLAWPGGCVAACGYENAPSRHQHAAPTPAGRFDNVRGGKRKNDGDTAVAGQQRSPKPRDEPHLLSTERFTINRERPHAGRFQTVRPLDHPREIEEPLMKAIERAADLETTHFEPAGCAPLVAGLGVSFDTDVLAADSRERNAPSS